MQAPVQYARNHHIPRKPRAMQEEQKRDRQLRRKTEILRRFAADRQNGSQNHSGHQHHGEAVRQEAGHGKVFPASVLLEMSATITHHEFECKD
ncbi:hypothetical protein D3C80_792160 [compost metagenome]